MNSNVARLTATMMAMATAVCQLTSSRRDIIAPLPERLRALDPPSPILAALMLIRYRAFRQGDNNAGINSFAVHSALAAQRGGHCGDDVQMRFKQIAAHRLGKSDERGSALRR